MLKRLFEKQLPLMVGIDIGSHSVKAVLLSKQDGRYCLEAYGIEPIPRGAVTDREVQDIEIVSKVLAKIRKKIPKKVKFAVAAVSGATVISKVIYMDANLSDDDLESQIEIEADSLIPYPLNEVSLDFEKLGVNESDITKVNVLLSAARTESIESRVEAIEAGGFEARVVDVESYALSRAAEVCLSQLPEEERGKVIALFDIGATMTLFSVIEGAQSIYSRDQMFGGDMYTQSISSYYQQTYEDSERAKVTNDLPANYTFEVLAPFQTSLIQQLRRALQMFLSTSGKENIDHVIISGGSSLIADIDQLMAEELGVDAIIANPFVDMEISDEIDKEQLEKERSQLMVATGLALRSFSPCHI